MFTLLLIVSFWNIVCVWLQTHLHGIQAWSSYAFTVTFSVCVYELALIFSWNTVREESWLSVGEFMFFCWRKCVRAHVTECVGVVIGIKGIVSVCDCEWVGNVWDLSCLFTVIHLLSFRELTHIWATQTLSLKVTSKPWSVSLKNTPLQVSCINRNACFLNLHLQTRFSFSSET